MLLLVKQYVLSVYTVIVDLNNITPIEEAREDDSESLITTERYHEISQLIKHAYAKKDKAKLSISDRIDRVVTNRILALPIFVLVMFLVYYISISTIGTQGTDWTNDNLFGDGYFFLGRGSAVGGIFAPLGFGGWKPTVATVTGLIAKENVVGTFGVLYGLQEVAENGWEIWKNMRSDFTSLSAFSFLLFNLLCAPCFAAMGAIKREMGSARWIWFAIGYQTIFAYTISLMVYHFGLLFEGQASVPGLSAAILVLAVYLYLLFRPAPKHIDIKKKKTALAE